MGVRRRSYARLARPAMIVQAGLAAVRHAHHHAVRGEVVRRQAERRVPPQAVHRAREAEPERGIHRSAARSGRVVERLRARHPRRDASPNVQRALSLFAEELSRAALLAP